MAIRTPESILCGHCASETGARTCPGCNLQICEGCAADRLSCPTPAGIEIELRRGRRLRSVDPTARWALASGPRRTWYRIDLDALTRQRVRTDIDEPAILATGELAGAVETGNVRLRIGARAFGRVFGALDRSGSALVSFRGGQAGVIVFFTGDPSLPRPGSRTITPFSDRAITAAGYDIAGDRLACAAGGVIAVWDLAGQRRIVELDIGAPSVRWLGLGGDVLAALVRDTATFELELRSWSLPDCTPIAWASLGRPRRRLVDLSPGGEIAAGAADTGEVAVLDSTGESLRLEGHAGGISALRVSNGATRLITGGFDRRILVRYRGADGFIARIARAALADAA